MRLPLSILILFASLAVSAVCGQAPASPAAALALADGPVGAVRLDESVVRPLVHVALTDPAPGAGSSAAGGSGADQTVVAGWDGSLGLLGEPGLVAVAVALGLVPPDSESANAERAGADNEGGGGDASRLAALPALEVVRKLARLSTGELEFAVVALLPRPGAADLPLMVGRLRLSEAGKTALGSSLDGDGFAAREREVAGALIYVLAGGSRQPGALFELALVGNDLLVANHAATLDDVVERSMTTTRTSSGPRPESLAVDAVHRTLVARLRDGDQRAAAARRTSGEPVAAPARAVMSVDWSRLQRRAMGARPGGRAPAGPLFGRPSSRDLALSALGLDRATRLVIGVEAGSQGAPTRTSLLIDQPAADRNGGLLRHARAVDPRRLVASSPVGALASLTVALDAERLSASLLDGPSGGSGPDFRTGVEHQCRVFGLDLERQILARLGETAAAQVVVLPDGQGAACALRFSARNSRAAQALLGDLREAAEQSGLLRSRFRLQLDRRREIDALDLLGPGGPVIVAAVGDDLVLAADRRAVQRVAIAELQTSRSASRRERAATLDLLESLAGDRRGREAVALFVLDPEQFGDQTPPRRHAGLVFVEDDALRIEVLTGS